MKYNKLIGAILLISGTTIGAGMLALPVSTGLAGFFPSTILLTACWLFMVCTAFLMLEVNLWMGVHGSLITMAKKTLGRPGEVLCWVSYLFLLYALTTAYIAGSEPIFNGIVILVTGYDVPKYFGSIPLLLLFGLCVYKGPKTVDYLNRILMIGLVSAFTMLVIYLFPNVDYNLLKHIEWKPLIIAVPIVMTAFGFHIIIPTLTTYLDQNIRQIRWAILIGSALPFFIYLLWEYLALGIIPLTGPHGIEKGFIDGTNGAQLISDVLEKPIITLLERCFSLFALLTSFLGVSLALTDFLADGFKIQKTRLGRLLLYLLTFIPPLIISVTDPRAFLTALEYAGTFGVVVLLGLLPPLMVWRGRYQHGFRSTFMVPGGKPLLLIIIMISIAAISLEIATKFDLITTH